MARYLGIDTSNYTTSAAIYDADSKQIIQRKRLLPVKEGALGLRQSDALFAHVKQLGEVMEELMSGAAGPLAGVGVSVRPRDAQGSYMPCFLAGEAAARTAAAAMGVGLTTVSHQAGHIAAALYSAGRLDLFGEPFAAFHLSGGTTECLFVRPGKERPFDIDIFSKSLDLKAGQAVDRVGAMLGLPFPAGPRLEALALRWPERCTVRPTFHGRDCCLSGIENRCAAMKEKGEPAEKIARFCLESILAAVRKMTLDVKAAFGDLSVIYAGGVMSNGILQKELAGYGFFAEPAFSSDNAAGVAILAHRAQTGGAG